MAMNTSQPISEPSADRPTALTALCVITLVLAALGLLTALQSCAGLAMNFATPSAVAAGPAGLNPELAEMQAVQMEMQAATRQLTMQWLPLTLPCQLLQFGLCLGLGFGAIQSLQMRANGRQTLLWSFRCGMVIEPIRTVIYSFASYQMLDAIQPFMGRMMNAQAPAGPGKAPPQLEEMVSSLVMVVGIASIIWFAIWLLLKLGFFYWSLSYLRREEVERMFR